MGHKHFFTNFRTCMQLANSVSLDFFKIKIKCVQPNMRLNYIHTDTIKIIKNKTKKQQSCTYLVQILPLTALVLCPLEKYLQTRQITALLSVLYIIYTWAWDPPWQSTFFTGAWLHLGLLLVSTGTSGRFLNDLFTFLAWAGGLLLLTMSVLQRLELWKSLFKYCSWTELNQLVTVNIPFLNDLKVDHGLTLSYTYQQA